MKNHPHKGLNYYWDRPVSELASRDAPNFSEKETQRHRIYLGLLTCRKSSDKCWSRPSLA